MITAKRNQANRERAEFNSGRTAKLSTLLQPLRQDRHPTNETNKALPNAVAKNGSKP
jgi:hypothetical protein